MASFIKVLIILLYFLSFNAFSQPATIVGTATGEPGDTVMIPIDYIGTGTGVVGFQVDVSFDNTVLTLGTANCADLGGVGVSCTDKGTYVRILVVDFGLNELPSGSMGFLEFTVSPGAAIPSVYPLTIISEEYSDALSNPVPPMGSIDGSIAVDQLFSVGGNISSLGVSSVTLQNNLGDDLIVSTNGAFVFSTKLVNLADYSVTVLNQPTSPDQTCLVSGGSGAIAAADVTDIQITCNDAPIVTPNSYVMLEDGILIADDVNGVVNDANDDSVLFNDSDDDALSIVTPGTFDPIGGMVGGSLTINANGTFDYTPPADAFGTALYIYEITDGFSVVSTFLSVDILPVNDQPSFDDMGNIQSFPFVIPPNTVVVFPNFATNIDLGSLESSSQMVSEFILNIVSDTNSILNQSNSGVANNGSLSLDLTLNEGVAVLQLILIDNGGTANGGVNTSIIHEFSVSFFNSVFENGFEEVLLAKFLQNNSGATLNDDWLVYKGHQLNLFDSSGKLVSMQFIEAWLKEINSLEQSN